MIKVVNGSFHYPNSALILDHICFELDDGEIMSVLGQNGIGKTTLLKCLTGIYSWTDGYAEINGVKIRKNTDVKNLGYVPQAHPMAFSYTVRQIVMMGRAKYIHLFAVPSKKDQEEVEKALEEVGIADLADRNASTLSGGQLQLAFIARALVSSPSIMVLDEPESHLDFKNQFLIMELIERLAQERKMSCIINTHYPDHALTLSDKTLLLGSGKFLFGNTETILCAKNIEEYFDVRSAILDVPDTQCCQKAFVVLGRTEKSA